MREGIENLSAMKDIDSRADERRDDELLFDDGYHPEPTPAELRLLSSPLPARIKADFYCSLMLLENNGYE